MGGRERKDAGGGWDKPLISPRPPPRLGHISTSDPSLVASTQSRIAGCYPSRISLTNLQLREGRVEGSLDRPRPSSTPRHLSPATSCCAVSAPFHSSLSPCHLETCPSSSQIARLITSSLVSPCLPTPDGATLLHRALSMPVMYSMYLQHCLL